MKNLTSRNRYNRLIFRTKYGEYPEYHTSLDDFKLVTLRGLMGGFKVLKAINLILDQIYPKNKILCEPHMNKRKPTRRCQKIQIIFRIALDFYNMLMENNINKISIN